MKISKTGVILGISIVTASGWATYSATVLSIAGTSVTTEFVTENGKVYVPLDDVAKALKMNVVKTGRSYALTYSATKSQAEALSGKIGDTLDAGFVSLKVEKVVTCEKYDYQFTPGVIFPDNDSQNIVVVVMRIKNETTRPMMIDPRGTEPSGIADSEDHLYPSYNGPYLDVPAGSDAILPQSSFDFALTFKMPKSESPQTLNYGIAIGGIKPPQKLFHITLAK